MNALQQALATGQNYFNMKSGSSAPAATTPAAPASPSAYVNNTPFTPQPGAIGAGSAGSGGSSSIQWSAPASHTVYPGATAAQTTSTPTATNSLASYLSNDLYGGVLGREADKSGYDWWLNAAAEKNWTADQLKEQFVAGAQPELQVKAMIDSLRPQTTNVPLYQSAPAPNYTPYQSQAFKYEADPGAAFRQEQGNKALQAKQLASGDFFSGGALKEAAEYNSGLASQEYGNAFNRHLATDAKNFNQHIGNFGAQSGAWAQADNAAFRNNNAAYDRQWNEDTRDYARWVDDYGRQTQADNTNWDRLTYLDQTGLNASGVGVNAGQNSASNIGNLLLNGGMAQAGGIINSNNVWQNALGNALFGLRK